MPLAYLLDENLRGLLWRRIQRITLAASIRLTSDVSAIHRTYHYPRPMPKS